MRFSPDSFCLTLINASIWEGRNREGPQCLSRRKRKNETTTGSLSDVPHRELSPGFPRALCSCVCFLRGRNGLRDTTPPPPTGRCDLASQEAEQRAYERDEYFPKRYSRDFFRDLGADISPTDDDYDLARKVSRSVFDIELRERDSGLPRARGTGWLIAPRYVATAAHNLTEQIGPVGQGRCERRDYTVHVHTFDGDTIDAEVVWFDEYMRRRHRSGAA